MSEQLRPNKRHTMVKFAIQKNSYTKGSGNKIINEFITVRIGTNTAGEGIYTDIFYVEWLNSYGALAIAQQAEGISQTARIRMAYIDTVYRALQSGQVKIFKNGIVDDENCYILASAPDNYLEGKKLLEFNVKHYEVK